MWQKYGKYSVCHHKRNIWATLFLKKKKINTVAQWHRGCFWLRSVGISE